MSALWLGIGLFVLGSVIPLLALVFQIYDDIPIWVWFLPGIMVMSGLIMAIYGGMAKSKEKYLDRITRERVTRKDKR
jgi:hypothetical protein